MPRRICLILWLACAALGQAVAQAPDSFTARLSPAPASLAELPLVGGTGEATATLSRGTLSITGSFTGLPSPATSIRVHQGTATGARGPAIAELRIDGATDGTFAGDLDLDRGQRAGLVAGHLYVQIYSDSGVPPDNAVLRGWLLGFDDASAARGRE